ncbi:MAG: hypothetical protein M3219_03340, partial [Thermoproteota archaeon]|nr:hypothetical protein [Thermoproteota archaeon]
IRIGRTNLVNRENFLAAFSLSCWPILTAIRVSQIKLLRQARSDIEAKAKKLENYYFRSHTTVY